MILIPTMTRLPSPWKNSSRRNRLIPLAALCLLMALWAGPAAAVPKTDIITLVNGDVITCEVKEMTRGKVRAKTDHMETVSIEWNKVTSLVSHYWFLISLRDGSLIYGQMSPNAPEGMLEVTFQDRTTEIPLGSVVEIQPIRYDVWDRIDMSVALGLSWNKGSQVFQSNADASAKYKGKLYSYGLTFSAMVTDRGNGEVFRRNQTDLWLGREISGKLHANVNVGTYRNDELGTRLRVSGGTSLGYSMIRGNHLEWRGLLGASINREWASEDSDPTNNAEGRLGTEFTLFYYDTPKSDITINADFYPNFTVSDRYRFEGSISGRQEIIKDLFIKLEYYESRDSKPPAGASAKEDRGIVFSIEWTK